MVRIAGIDREISTLELMWAQGDPQEKVMLALNTVVEVLKVTENGEATIEMQDDKKYKIKLEEIK